jgi:hypothetical protein
MNRLCATLAALAVTGLVALTPTAAAASGVDASYRQRCSPTRPAPSFYAAGRVGSEELFAPTNRRCTTISVSHIRDPRIPADRCQTFLVGFWPLVNGSLTYTDPVRVCSVPAGKRTVLVTDVPDGAHFIILYQVDYIDPVIQTVRYKAWF